MAADDMAPDSTPADKAAHPGPDSAKSSKADRELTPVRWGHVRSLFAAAIQLDAVAQAKYLDEACGDDEAIRSEVRELLSASADAGSFLGAKSEEGQADPLIGREFDSYRLVRRIGQGGMGAVYLGLRSDQEFERRVAVKLMGRHISGEEAMSRFRTERQILAGLDHPHIAKLLDGGTTPEGLPYLVMEYVEGQPIDEYCASRELSIHKRLILFLSLCSAVQFAHRNLVVHRDLKPTNVLVDGQGHLKLLDFGIAKLLNPELSPQGLAPTVSSLQALTPEYASPEQVLGEPVTTASDVYSLGVVLYVLLTGSLPYDVGRNAPAAMFRAICTDPPRPASEAADPSRARKLRGDLDNILEKALRKKPHRRYVSVEQLADDVRSYLDGRPVGARAATWTYRLGKFLRRHPWGAVATALLVVSSLAFGGMMSAKNVELERQRDLAEQSKDLVVEVFESTDPYFFRGYVPTLKEVIDRSAGRIEMEFLDQPHLRSELLGILGTAYLNAGDAAHASRLLKLAIEARSEVEEPSSPAMVTLRNKLAGTLQVLGEYSEAEDLFRTSLDLYQQDDEVRAAALNGLATVFLRSGRNAEAEPLLIEALDLLRRTLGPRDADGAATLNDLGGL